MTWRALAYLSYRFWLPPASWCNPRRPTSNLDRQGGGDQRQQPAAAGGSARDTKVTRAAPRDAAREAAAIEAARQAEVRALADRVQQLQGELEQSRRETPPPVAYVAPQMPYMPAPTYIVNVVSPPAPAYAAPTGGCGYGYGLDCGFGFWPGFYTSTPIVIRGKHPHHHRRIGPVAGQQHLIPPLIPLPTQTRPGGGSRGRG